ncbi:putative outer membrane receptor for iron transport [Sulfitobacter noctilucicola]|uniref:Catecholate siderophore receptor n=1 Tax=Sulfitobacter noctilucicola TaxID=1342301 RepID=A0A7W6MA06_9RHOB|nr:TonB-dependent siderophore receptor [Sulfitobacter noctilucicola]KIN63343.1 putative outer membrane receptor for iron transport [Sulfitobacter noctilucicola]MBB4175139.1 catecholate siderophore receptor [Sulfitobacter noctilucicola]
MYRTPERTANAGKHHRKSSLVVGGFGASLAMACMATSGSAQDTDLIVLPTVEVETTEEPTPPRKTARAPVKAKPAPRRAAKPRAATPTVCTPALAGTPVCAAEEAAEREAQQLAKAQALAEAKEAAGGSSYADPDAPFKANTLANSRMPGPLEDNPRTVTAITQEVLETTGTTSVRELARSTPGISLGFGEGGNSFGDNIYIRGFKANNDTYTDGVRSPGTGVAETFNTEQVEVVKGPAGTVGGRGTTGGAIDVISKKTQDIDFTRTVTTLTDASTVRQTIDTNKVINDRLQLRFNGMLQDGNVAGRDNAADNRKGAALAMTFQATDALTFEGNLSYTKIEQTPDWGVPYVNNEELGLVGPVTEFGIDRSTFYGVPGRDFQVYEETVATAKAQYDFDNGMKLTNTFRASRSLNDYVLTAPSSLRDNDSTNPEDWQVGLSFKSWYQETEVLANVLELSGEGRFAGATHEYVVGFATSREEIEKLSYSNLSSEDYLPPDGQRGCTVSAINPNPIAEGCWSGEQPQLGTDVTATTVKTTSLYALDTVTLSDRWKVNGGLRIDMYDIERTGVSGGEAYSLSRDDVMFNWNLGTTYAVTDRLNVYAAAATSTNPAGQELEAGGGFYGGLDTNGSGLAPEENTSLEVGAKFSFTPDLLLTAALYQTTKDQAREDVGPRGASVTSDTLKYRIQGLELGVAGKVTERLSLFGGANFMNSKILESADSENVGLSVANVAHEQLNILATYQVTDRLMIGGRVNYQGSIDLGSVAANGRSISDALTFDLLGEYAVADNAKLKMGITNVADKTVYDAAYRSGTPFTYVAPGREISVSLEMKF